MDWRSNGVIRPLSLDYQGEVEEAAVEEVIVVLAVGEESLTATRVSESVARKAALVRRVRRGMLLERFANPCNLPGGHPGGGGRFGEKDDPACGGAGAGYGAGSGVPKGPFSEDQFNAKGKPIPGTDAWLHAHNISPSVWEDRPYVRFEAGAGFDSLPAEVRALYEDEPEAKRQLSKMMAQTGGLIMVRKTVPGAEGVVPQTRPDDPVVTDMGKRAFRASSLANANKRLEQMKELDGAGLLALQEGRVERARSNLEAAGTMDRDKFLEYARGRVAQAEHLVAEVSADLPKRGTKQIDVKSLTPEQADDLENARAAKVKAAKILVVAEQRANFNFGDPSVDSPEIVAEKTARFREVETNNATKALARAEKKLGKIQGLDEKGVQDAIDQEIKTAAGFATKAQNAYDKTAAKYLFPPNPLDQIDSIAAGRVLGKAGRVNVHGEENLRNLTEGKGRVYLAMEGAQKEDSLLTAIQNEAEEGASVISVPSVTLWRNKEMKEVAEKYLAGREVVLIPDADGVNNPRVRNEARALQALLEGAGARVVVAPPPIPLLNGKPIPDPAHPSKVQQFETVIPGSPNGTVEQLKGVDDYLGLGKAAAAHGQSGERPLGTLGNLAVQRRNLPSINLTDVVRESARPNAEAALRAISLIAGSKDIRAVSGGGRKKVAAAQIGTTMLAAAMGEIGSRNAATRSLVVLEKAGVIKIERIYDEDAYARGIRRQHPDMTDGRLTELVRAGVIDRPAFGDDDTRPIEYGSEENPIISINTEFKTVDGRTHDFSSVDDTPIALNQHSPGNTSSARIRSLSRIGWTQAEIADILGISASTISNALR